MKFGWRKIIEHSGFTSSPQVQLLSAICSAQPHETELEDWLRSELIWPDLLERAIAYDLAPLLYYRLKHLRAARLVPPAVMNRLKTIYQWHTARNMNLYAKLQEVRDTFAQNNIPLILLKGAVLADLIYGNLALRPMRDLDVLVRNCDLDVADNLLRKLGYSPNEAYRPEAWFRNYHHNIPYISADRSLTLELHYHIVPPAAPVLIPAEDLWQDAHTVTIMNEEAAMLSPEKFLLHLCVHLSYDDRFYRSLRALVDIAATILFHKQTIDWTKFIGYASAWKADRSVYYALWLAHSLVYADIPVWVLDSLAKTKGNSRLSDFLLKRFIRRSISAFENQNTAVPAWVMRNFTAQLLLSDTASQSIMMLSRHFPPRYIFTKLFHSLGQKCRRVRCIG